MVHGKNVKKKEERKEMKNEQTQEPIRILLADDDVDDRTFFVKALKEIPLDTQLIIVHDGEQLMKYLNENSENLPGLLFLDLSMPRKTGFECLAEIKENKWLKNLHVIVFTTSFGRGVEFEHNLKNTLSNIGAEEYIRKPSDPGQLKEIIHTAILKHIEKERLSGKDKKSGQQTKPSHEALPS